MSEIKQEKVIKVAKQSRISLMLDKYFHFTERNSTAGREVKAGLSVFFISVCALFMNIQIVMEAFEKDVPYCGLYLGAVITAFIGTLLLGVVCNLPLVQTASLSLSSVMISLLGVDSGLTYANLLTVTFVAALVYAAVVQIPKLKGFVYHLLPDCVRNALPAALGLYVIYTALDKMGVIDGMSLADLSNDGLGGAAIAPYMRLCVIAGLIGFVLVILFIKRKAATPVFSGFLTATLIFFLIASVAGGIAFTYVYTQNRIWVGVNPDPLGEMYTIALGFKELQLGTVFTEGFDFSVFTAAGGNVIVLFIRSILLFLFMGMYESEGSALGADVNEDLYGEDYEKRASGFLAVNAITNVIAPIVGAAPVSVAKQSAAASADGGKTGLSSVVCALGYLISMFTWLPFVIFATYTKSVPEYGHAGFVFPNVIFAAFQIADAVMLVMGILMMKNMAKLKNMKFEEAVPFILTVILTAFTQNIAIGAGAGVIIFVFLKLAGLKKTEIKSVMGTHYFMAAISVVLLLTTLVMPVLGSPAAGNSADKTAAGSSESGAQASSDSTGFSFDEATGDFSFTAGEGMEYYTIWVCKVDEEGVEADNYSVASPRLTGSGEITGNVDISTLAFGEYHAKLLGFSSDGTNPDPVVKSIQVSGKLSTPEFMYTQSGAEVTITLFSDTLSTYFDSEKFTELEVNIYDESGAVVSSEMITENDIETSAMGPMTSYSCAKTLTLEEGTYEISITAQGEGDTITASDESEKLTVTVSGNGNSEGKTAGYVEQQDGPPGM